MRKLVIGIREFLHWLFSDSDGDSPDMPMNSVDQE